MSDVFPIHGGVTHRKANALTVEALERLLEKAKSGEIIGVAAAFVYGDFSASFMSGGVMNNALIGSITRLNAAMIEGLDNA